MITNKMLAKSAFDHTMRMADAANSCMRDTMTEAWAREHQDWVMSTFISQGTWVEVGVDAYIHIRLTVVLVTMAILAVLVFLAQETEVLQNAGVEV